MNVSRHSLQTLICISGFLDLFGVAMIYPLLVHHAKNMGATPSQVGYFSSLYGFLQLFSSPIMGQASDHFGRRNMLMLSLIIVAFGYLSLGFSTNIVMLYLARLPSGLFKHSQSLSRTYLADITPKEERSVVFGLFNSVSSFGFIVGPTVGGFISVTENGFLRVSILSSSLFLLNFLLVYMLFPRQQKSKDVDEKPIDIWRCMNGFKDVHLIPWSNVWDAFLTRFLLSFAIILFRANFTAVLAYRFNVDPVVNGYIMSFNGILAAITGFSVRWIAPQFSSNTSLHNTFAVVMVMSLVSITIAPSLFFVICGIMPLCVSSAILRVTNASAIFNRCDIAVLGLINGLSDTLTSLARALGPLIAGIAQEISIYGPGFCGTFVALIGTLVGFYTTLVFVGKDKEHKD